MIGHPGSNLRFALVLCAATMAVYANTLSNGFVWDDNHIIVHNPSTRELSDIGHVLVSADEFSTYYRPLNRASYLLDYQVFGLNPVAFHAVNVAVHLLAVLALFALGLRLFPTPIGALAAAALLAVHPIASEPVNFVTARNNLFALVFSLSALVLFIDGARRRSLARACLSAAALFLGLMSKEQAIGALAVIAAWPFLARRWGDLGTLRADPLHEGGPKSTPAWRILAPHAIAVLTYLTLRAISVGLPTGAAGAHETSSLLTRLRQNYYTIPRYLTLAIYPRALTIFHTVPDRLQSTSALPIVWALVLLGLALLVRHRSLASDVGLLWLAFNFLPLANLVPIPSALFAERYFYVPAAGLWILAGDAISRVLASRCSFAARAAMTAAVVAALAGLGARTIARNRDWHDDVSLAQSAIAVDPSSIDARFNLGVVLKDAGQIDAARRAWEAALVIDPRSPKVLMQMGTLAATSGRLDEARAWYERALASDPAIPLAHYNLALILDRQGHSQDALRHYEAFVSFPMLEYENAPFVAFARHRLAVLRPSPTPLSR